MEQIRDLLVPDTGVRLKVHEDPKQGIYIKGVKEQ